MKLLKKDDDGYMWKFKLSLCFLLCTYVRESPFEVSLVHASFFFDIKGSEVDGIVAAGLLHA